MKMAEGKSEVLVQKHKQERKELQARVQVLKKSICKGDKKKKKEICEEIAHLESELNHRHEIEMANMNASQLSVPDLPTKQIMLAMNNDTGVETNASMLSQRISKAQKRRIKKSIAEKERNERIIEQEASNIVGKRSIETKMIEKLLGEHELIIYDIPSDGHCLYNAVAHQLKTIGGMPLGLQDLRQKTALYLRENMDDFLPFLSNNDSDELLSPEQYDKYCDNVASTSAWGGDVELQVLSRVLECPIEIVQATGKPYLVGSGFSAHKKIILTYHRHLYELGAHYNSVTKYIRKEDR